MGLVQSFFLIQLSNSRTWEYYDAETGETGGGMVYE